jgi:hypothetical protein
MTPEGRRGHGTNISSGEPAECVAFLAATASVPTELVAVLLP